METCNYRPGIRDEMLRDRLVVSMKDKALAEQLQLDPELTLEKVKRKMRQKEAVKEQNMQLKDKIEAERGPVDSVDTNTTDPRPVDAMRASRSQRRGATRTWRDQGGTAKPQQCTQCGNEPHPAGARCPAADTVCRRCNRKGHYEAMCYSKTIAPAHALVVDSAFLGALRGMRSTNGTPQSSLEERQSNSR